jgi:hypothetical protein
MTAFGRNAVVKEDSSMPESGHCYVLFAKFVLDMLVRSTGTDNEAKIYTSFDQ